MKQCNAECISYVPQRLTADCITRRRINEVKLNNRRSDILPLELSTLCPILHSGILNILFPLNFLVSHFIFFFKLNNDKVLSGMVVFLPRKICSAIFHFPLVVHFVLRYK